MVPQGIHQREKPGVGKNAANHGHGGAEVLCPEENPGKVHQKEGHRHPENPEAVGIPVDTQDVQGLFPAGFGCPADDLVKTVQQPPYHKGPVGPVPQSAEQEDDEDVAVGFPPAAAAAAQGEVDIIPEPGA